MARRHSRPRYGPAPKYANWTSSPPNFYETFDPGYWIASERFAAGEIALSNPFKVFHADHGITAKQMSHIEKHLEKKAPQGFFILQVNIPKRLGPVPSALYGPDAGDAPVPESSVHYMDRAGRGWEDRMVDLPVRAVNYVQTIGIREGDDFTLFTVYGGPLAPQNPADPGNQDPKGSKKWWSQHALSSQQWAGKNPNHLDSYKRAYERQSTGAGTYHPEIFPYGMKGWPARYVKAKKNSNPKGNTMSAAPFVVSFVTEEGEGFRGYKSASGAVRYAAAIGGEVMEGPVYVGRQVVKPGQTLHVGFDSDVDVSFKRTDPLGRSAIANRGRPLRASRKNGMFEKSKKQLQSIAKRGGKNATAAKRELARRRRKK